VATGILLAAVGSLVVVWLVGAAGQRVEVLVLRADVPYGQALTAADLGVARISVDPGVAIVPADQRPEVVGSFPMAPLTAGSLLSPSMIGSDSGPPAGQSLVPLAISAERMPALGLRPGDRILAVDAGAITDSGAGVRVSAPYSFPATVVRVGPADVNGTSVVDVTTGSSAAPALSVASANGRIAIVVQPTGR